MSQTSRDNGDSGDRRPDFSKNSCVRHLPIKFLPQQSTDWRTTMPQELAAFAEKGRKHRDSLRYELAMLWWRYCEDGEFSVCQKLLEGLYSSDLRKKMKTILEEVATKIKSHSNFAGNARCTTYRFNLSRPKKPPTYNGIPPEPAGDPISAQPEQVCVVIPGVWLWDRYERWAAICEKIGWVSLLDLDGRTDWGRPLFEALDLASVPDVPETERLTMRGVVKAARRKNGRCYHPLTNLRKDLRRATLFDSESTSEVDIASCYTTLLVSQVPNGPAKDRAICAVQADWYAQFKDAYSEWFDRQLAIGKGYISEDNQWMIRLDDDPKHDVRASIKVEFQRQCLFWRDGRDESNPIRVAFRRLHPELCQMIECWRQRMTPTELSHVLTRAEGSMVVDYAMSELEKAGIAAVPIHDGLLVKARQAEYAKTILLSACKWHLGFEPRVAVKTAETTETVSNESMKSCYMPYVNGGYGKMKFAKIEVVDRIRRIGLWEDANWLKDEFRRRMITEGKSRKEARDLAWEEIARVFEVEFVDCYDAAVVAAGADFPPSVDDLTADQEGEPSFNLIWKLWYFVQARRECLMSGSSEALDAINDRITHAGIDSGDIETARLAHGDEKRFLQLSISKILAVIQRLKATANPKDDQTVSILDDQIEEMWEYLATAGESQQMKQVGDTVSAIIS